MQATLSPDQRRRYECDGFLFPLAALEPEEVSSCLQAYDELDPLLRAAGLAPPHAQCHLHFQWAFELATNPSVLDAVEDVIGPDILVHSSTFFCKQPRDPGFVSWHQDAHNWQLDEPRLVSAWVALTESDAENGCMRAIAGSHRQRLAHAVKPHPDNMLRLTGLEVELEIDEASAVDFVLAPGQMSLHHADVVHGSNPNVSDRKRLGFAIRYVAPDVRQSSPHHEAVLARGDDPYGHYELLERPPGPGTGEGPVAHRAFWERRSRQLGRDQAHLVR